MKKKLLALLCILSLSVAALAGCGSSDAPASGSAAADQASAAEETADPVDVNVMALKGPTAMGMVKFMNDAESVSCALRYSPCQMRFCTTGRAALA